MEPRNFLVSEGEGGERLDKWLMSQELELSRSQIQRLIEEGRITVNGGLVSKKQVTHPGDQVIVALPEPQEWRVLPEDLPLDIVYQDEDLLVVNKAKGMVVHPAPGNPSGTLVNALLSHCQGQLSGINGVIRPGIVHRIDKNTSGLLIVAKNDASHAGLAKQIQAHSFQREYEAVVCGRMPQWEGTVHAPIGRHPTNRKKMCVTDRNSRDAVTHYRVLEEAEGYTHVRLRLETGRTHQIRVHMAYLGRPVLGDDVYGKPYPGLEGQCLHAKTIGFLHPRTGEWMEFDSPLPEYFLGILRKLRFLDIAERNGE